MKTLLTYYLGEAFGAKEGGQGEFSKDVLRVGRYVHPATKQVVNIDEALLSRLEKSTNAYLATVGTIPFPDGHKWDAQSNLGHWGGPFKKIGDRLFGIVKVTEPKAADLIRNGTTRGVSAVIEFGKTDQSGKVHPEVITQVCATDYPVVTQQGGFVELSALDEKQLLDMFGFEAARKGDEGGNGTGGQDMDLSKLIEALGLPKDSDQKTVLEKAGQSVLAARDGAAKLEALSAALSEHGLKLDDGKIVKVEKAPEPEPTAKEKELMDRLAAAESDSKAARLEVEKARLVEQRKQLQALSASGRIPPALLPKLEKLMSVTGKVEAMVLSADGGTVANEQVSNLGALLMDAFKALPTQVDLANAMAWNSPEKGKAAEELKKRSREIAARVGKVKEEAK